MCGRFIRTSPRARIADEFGVEHFVNVDFKPRYNIAPSQSVEAIIRDGAELRLGPMTWGYTTSAADKTKPAPMRKVGNTKTPYFIRLRSARPFGFAGIWSSTRTVMGQRIGTCAILTCAPNELMAPIHNRMPVILAKGARDRSLDSSADTGELQSLLTPFPADQMEAYAVSTLVNSARNDTPECIAPVVG
jgi:putative SOS response-associated peptidase YedK